VDVRFAAVQHPPNNLSAVVFQKHKTLAIQRREV
jgi:hypothetical protein